MYEGGPGNRTIYIEYKVISGNGSGYPNENEFDVEITFNYEDAQGATLIQNALVETRTMNEWINEIGSDWMGTWYGSVDSNYEEGQPPAVNIVLSLRLQILKLMLIFKILKFPEEIPGFSLESHFFPLSLYCQT